MPSYNLTDNVNESFEFTIGGVAYKMRYPLVEEMEEFQRLVREYNEAEKRDENPSEKPINDFMYSYITPVDENSSSIEETLKKQNIKVLQNFNTMFRTEFGVS